MGEGDELELGADGAQAAAAELVGDAVFDLPERGFDDALALSAAGWPSRVRSRVRIAALRGCSRCGRAAGRGSGGVPIPGH